MAWLTDNWFWILTFIAFVAMHRFGHGGHGGHGGGKRQSSLDGNDESQNGTPKPGSGGHQH